MTSSYAIRFKSAADFDEAQLELSQRCWHGGLPSARFNLGQRWPYGQYFGPPHLE